MGAIHYVGTSGWVYPHWRGVFYPPTLSQPTWLGYYAGRFTTVELNSSFYRLPSEQAFARWRDTAPEGFVFAVKASRFITHVKRLRDIEGPLEALLSRSRHLGDRLGPVLYQIPPTMHRNDERLDGFLSLLPEGHRHVVEFRHSSWLDEEVFSILRRHNVGLCVFDMPGMSCPVVATSGFAYIRLHGSAALYSSCYTDGELDEWAQRISRLAEGLDAAYIYFNNDAEGHAVHNAQSLAQRLGA